MTTEPTEATEATEATGATEPTEATESTDTVGAPGLIEATERPDASGTPDEPLTRWERLRHRIVTPPAIYGTLLVAALIGTSDDGESDFDILTTTVPTLLVFWVAHVFAEGIAHYGQHGHNRVTMRDALRFSTRHSSGLLFAGIVPCGLLVLGAAGIMEEVAAYGLALLFPVVLLGALGWFALADRGARWPGKLLAAWITSSLGFIVIILKIAFH